MLLFFGYVGSKVETGSEDERAIALYLWRHGWFLRYVAVGVFFYVLGIE